MTKIPAAILNEILALRSENGLEATDEALQADLAKSKAKWVLEETPRYRKAGRSPIYVSGKYLSSYGVDPATGERDTQAGKKAKASDSTPRKVVTGGKAVDEAVFYKVLHGKGYPVKISQDLITGEIQTQIPASITKLNLQFSSIPSNAADVHVTQTSPQIQVAMPLDKFLELAGIKA
jgi:hypothetical protein